MWRPRYISTIPLYYVRVFPPETDSNRPPLRLLKISPSCLGDTISPRHITWKRLYFKHGFHTHPMTRPYLPLNHAFPPIVRLPEHVIAYLFTRAIVMDGRVNHAQLPWSGNPPLTLTFRYEALYDSLYVAIQLGLCPPASETSLPEPGSFWANLRGSTSIAYRGDGCHECPADHILSWPGLERVFVMITHATEGSPFGERTMKWMARLAFTQAPDV